MIKVRARAWPHMFKAGETVEAVIKKVNCHDVMGEELAELLQKYHEINGSHVPRAATQALIPVLVRHQTKVFGKKR
jgi:hypothetical protein